MAVSRLGDLTPRTATASGAVEGESGRPAEEHAHLLAAHRRGRAIVPAATPGHDPADRQLADVAAERAALGNVRVHGYGAVEGVEPRLQRTQDENSHLLTRDRGL